MINFHQLEKALRRQGIAMSDTQLTKVLNDLQPNPISGFGVGGAQVWGDSKSIDEVKHWHHAHNAVVPSLRHSLELGQQLGQKAIRIAVEYGGIDGAHHKSWVIDQMVRTLAGSRYDDIVTEAKSGADGPETYEWDEGIAP